MAKKPTTKKTNVACKKAINETGRRKPADRRQKDIGTPLAGERRKVQRRRQIDPTTCERDYSNEEVEFMQALDQYKRESGRMFPTCSEILEVIRKLGYSKRESQIIASQVCSSGDHSLSSINLNAVEI